MRSRSMSTAVVLLTVGTLATAPAFLSAAHASDPGGFSSEATATPLKVEIYEPAIPIPADPQAEFDVSYTRVDGQSGPVGTARASAMWPGDSIGEGFKTVGEQVGLPAALTQNGYPQQVNADSTSDKTQAAQEPLPGMVTRVNATDHKATAKVGYGGGGDVAEGDPDGSATPPPNPLTALSGGDLSALGSIITGSSSGNADTPVPSSPLGALSVLVNPTGMESISTTDYSGDKVIATATSRLGQLSLIGGLVKLTGVEVVARTTSSQAAGATTSTRITYGGMTIAGVPFAMTSDGLVGGGPPVAIPGLPSNASDALKALGISLDVPKPVVTKDGASASIAARGLVVTIDTQPLRAKLPALPIGDFAGQLPDSAGQLKSLLLAASEAHPKLVLSVGAVTSQATTVAAIGADGSSSAPDTSASTGASGGASTGTGGAAGAVGTPGEVAPAATATPTSTTPVKTVSAVPGLPPLGGVPGMLTLLGLLIAGGAGWYLRRAGGLLFGAGNTCSLGLKAGVPDLRKA